LSNTKNISPKTLERDYFKFKEEFAEIIKSEEKRSDLKLTAQNIHVKSKEIESTPIQKDFLEKQGFSYDDRTFDDLFVRGWKKSDTNAESLSTESSSSEAEEEPVNAVAEESEETKEIV
jgi:hypothetical protein